MSILRNIAVGALSEGINQMEQKDRMYAEIAVDAGKNYFQNVLPKSIEAENLRKSNYDKIFNLTGDRNFAELMDRDGFTTQANAVDFATNLYKTVDKEKLKSATLETNFEDRYNQRVKSRDEMYQPMLKELGFGIGTMGPNIMKSLVEEDFVTGKDTQTAKKPTEAADMTQQTGMKDTDAAPAATTTISDFIIQPQISFDVPESEFQKVASTMRGFGQFFTQDPNTGEPVVNLNDTNRNEYGALRNLTQEIAQNYLDQDGNVNVSAAMTAASNMLTKQTSIMIYGRQLADRYEQGIASADGNSFSQNFNIKYKTDGEKKQYLAVGLKNLDGGKDAQRFFAQSFPKNVVFDDNTSVRDYLLRLTGLKR